MSSITLKQLNEFAKNAGVSQDATIYPLGAEVSFMVAYRDIFNGEVYEYIILDEGILTRADIKGGSVNNREILLVWNEELGEASDFRCCATCDHCNINGTRDTETGYCNIYRGEVDLDNEECKNFEW